LRPRLTELKPCLVGDTRLPRPGPVPPVGPLLGRNVWRFFDDRPGNDGGLEPALPTPATNPGVAARIAADGDRCPKIADSNAVLRTCAAVWFAICAR
jgi:hypothetical protein